MLRRHLHTGLLILASLLALGAGGPTLAHADAGAPAADSGALLPAGGELLQQGCRYAAAVTASGTPVVGATVTVVETGAAARTDAGGRYDVPLPGAGNWTVQVTAPGYNPLTIRLVIGPDCTLVSRTVDAGEAPPAAPAAPSPGAQRFSGSLTIDGQPAPAGLTVAALIGERPCGSRRTTTAGRYSIDVVTAAAAPGCGDAGVEVQFLITPTFGSGWRASGGAPFQSGGATRHDLNIDLTRLQPLADNVPWNGTWWSDTSAVRIGICSKLSAAADSGVQGAFRQWREASRTLGSRANLVSDAEGACGDTVPGIAVVEDVIDEPNAIAGAVSLDAGFNPCSSDAPCWAHKSLIVINGPVFSRLPASDRANVLAHEIGHALGLGHAAACTGGTIMWATTRCRFPVTHVGVDDIASLNAKIAAAGEPAAATPASPDGAAALGGNEQLVGTSAGGGLAARVLSRELLAAIHWEWLADDEPVSP